MHQAGPSGALNQKRKFRTSARSEERTVTLDVPAAQGVGSRALVEPSMRAFPALLCLALFTPSLAAAQETERHANALAAGV
jgi:hypothetical protein